MPGDRPIIFSAPMVRALLEGRKTQTRRVLKPQPWDGARYTGIHFAHNEPDTWFFNSPIGPFKTPVRWEVGDRLWVRETHALLPRTAYRGSVGTGTIAQMEHPRDGYSAAVFREGFDRSGAPRWRPSIHMPRWASRITLTVTDERVQRLQEINEADAAAEGGLQLRSGRWVTAQGEQYAGLACHSARGWFSQLWDQIHGPGAWDANPWVVALTFTVARQNIDAEMADA